MLKIPPAQYWRKIVSRGKYPLLLIYELNEGLLKSHQVTGFKVKLKNYCRVSGGSYLYEPEAKKFIRCLIRVLEQNPKETLHWLDSYYKNTRQLFYWIKNLPQAAALKELTLSQLKHLYASYEKRVQVIWRWGYLPFLIDEAIETVMSAQLLKLGIKPRQVPKIIKTLSVSPKFRLLQEQEFELLKLASKIKKVNSKKYRELIEKHCVRWGWRTSWLYFQYDVTFADVKKEVARLSKQNPKKLLNKTLTEKKRKLQQKKKLLSRFHDKKLNILSKILAEYIFWHSYKIEEMTRAIYLTLPLFNELAKRLNLSYKQLIELTPIELQSEKINRQTLKERQKDVAILMINGHRQILSGKNISKAKRVFEKKIATVSSLRGQVAFPGRVTGRVVVISSGEINLSKTNFKNGSVLVTSMTTTNMVPLVKIAAAIVTDEGGITCHAAIITRELNKPCIVGTKVATKALKDGDLVEVDANKGIIKIIKKR